MSNKNYNDAYWRANRKRLLKERAERYRKDKAFRLAAISRSRAKVALNRVLRPSARKVVTHAGNNETVSTITGLAHAANRSKDVVYRLRKLGIIPASIYKDARGNSLYANSQVAYVKSVFALIDVDDVYLPYPALGRVLHKVWYHTWELSRLVGEISKELDNEKRGKESAGKTRNDVNDQERRGNADKRKVTGLRPRASSSSRKPGQHVEHGELSVTPSRRRSGAAVLNC